jgi:hypothetical protein
MVGHQRDVAVTTAKTLLIEADAGDFVGGASSKSSRHRPVHDALHTVPVQAQQLSGLGERSTRQEHLHGEGLKHQGKARTRLGPRRHQRDHLVLFTRAARQRGSDLRGELHHVQMSPRALRRMVVTPALPLALRATHRFARFVLHLDVHQPLRDLQLRTLHPPRTLDAQQHPVMGCHRCLCFSFSHASLNLTNCGFATRKPEEPARPHESLLGLCPVHLAFTHSPCLPVLKLGD